MLAQAQLYTGTNVANTPLTTPIVVSSVVGNTGSDLFTDSTIADNSLLNLIKGLPSGTRVSYGSDAVSPNDGGKWIILAQSPKGGWTCVDYTGMFKSYGNTDKGAIEMDGGFSWFTCGS